MQLITAANDTHLWAETYDRKLTDIFVVESDIATTIAKTLQARLTGAEKTAIAKRPTANPEAYELYLKGRFFWNKRTAADLRKAIEYFNQALDKDPSYAPAYAGLTDAYLVLSQVPELHLLRIHFPKQQRPRKKRSSLRRHASRSTHLACLLSRLLRFRLRAITQRISARHRVRPELRHRSSLAWEWGFLRHLGNSSPPSPRATRALEFGPLLVNHQHRPRPDFFYARRYDEADRPVHKRLMDPRFYFAHSALGAALPIERPTSRGRRRYITRQSAQRRSIRSHVAWAGVTRDRTAGRSTKMVRRLVRRPESHLRPALQFCVDVCGLRPDKEHAIDEMERRIASTTPTSLS